MTYSNDFQGRQRPPWNVVFSLDARIALLTLIRLARPSSKIRAGVISEVFDGCQCETAARPVSYNEVIMNKYRNQKIEVDGMTFDSRKEYKRWQELRLLQRAGEITELERQVPFGLMPSFKCNGHLYRPTTYIADFTYYDKNHKYIVEDVKGVRTKEYMIKKKLLAWVHGYEIQEV